MHLVTDVWDKMSRRVECRAQGGGECPCRGYNGLKFGSTLVLRKPRKTQRNRKPSQAMPWHTLGGGGMAGNVTYPHRGARSGCLVLGLVRGGRSKRKARKLPTR